MPYCCSAPRSWYINDYLAGGEVVLDANELMRDIVSIPVLDSIGVSHM